MKPVASCLFILALLCAVHAFGQGENNKWCFGQNGGVDFNSGTPVSFVSSCNTVEPCASVSDAAGNLLFYASGTDAFDRNHNVMPNGAGLLGNASSTQGTAIVQSYTNLNQYYLFTLNALEQVEKNLRYSVVDMSLNGGLGDIVVGQKNIILDTNVKEKMTIANGTGCSKWLIVHEPNTPMFHTYKIDNNGINTTPVISLSGFHYAPNAYMIGEMRVAAGDSNIALVNYTGPIIELHSFDKSTGVVSGAIKLDSIIAGSERWYGLSYSPDGSKLYVPTFNSVSPSLYQYDVSLLPNVAAVQASRTQISNSNYQGMRIGPDGKVYMVGFDNFIYAVNNPNVAWPGCNVAITPLTGFGYGGTLGTAFVANVLVDGYVSHDTMACLALDTLSIAAPPGYNTYLWSDGKTSQTDSVTAGGTKWVLSTNACGTRVDTFHVAAMVLNANTTVTDTAICFTNIATLWGSAGYTSYRWSDGIGTQQDTMSGPGTKWVRQENINACSLLTDTFHVAAIPVVTTSTVTDTDVCFVNNIPILSGPAGYNTYTWSDGFTVQQDTMSAPGTKWVRAQTGCTIAVDTFKLHDWRDTTKIITDTSHCVAYSPITIFAAGGYTSYIWSDGKTTQADTFFATTTKWVRAQNGCNLLLDTVHFAATTVPSDSITMHGTDTAICFENVSAVNVIAPGGYTYYLWSDGTPVQADAFNGPGTKWVYAQKLCALLIDTFSVQAKGIDTTTERTDTYVCFSEIAIVGVPMGYDTYFWSDGNVGVSDTVGIANPIKYVAMHRACELAVDTFHVTFVNGLSVNLGNDTALCKGETIQLNAATSYPGVAYQWQDNSTAAVYNVTTGGDYMVKVSVGPCSVSDTVRVHQKIIDVKLGNGNVPCGNEELVLDAGVDSSSYLWQDGSKNRTFKATSDGEYSVKVTQGLCSTTAKVSVQFEACPCTVVIPTGFSPNGDGKNDQFGATVSCRLNSYKMMVYSRWGSRVFYSESVDDKWDGTVKGIAVDGDVYYYYLEFKDGENKVYYYKGDVTVVR